MSIDLLLDQSRVEAGDEVTGFVRLNLEPEKVAKASQVTVRLFARIHGSGTAEEVQGETRRIPAPFQVGERIAFKLRTPKDGPLTYAGRYVKIDWIVRAELDIPWAIDPKEQTSVVVGPRRRARGDALTA